MGYAAEEDGLLGSKEIAAKYSSEGKHVIGMLQIDMIGYKGSSKDLYIIEGRFESRRLNKFLKDLMIRYLPKLKFGYTSCGYPCSDHASWTENGFPASLVFEADFDEMNPNYHSGQDKKVNKSHMKNFAQLAAVYIAELAKGHVSKNMD